MATAVDTAHLAMIANLAAQRVEGSGNEIDLVGTLTEMAVVLEGAGFSEKVEALRHAATETLIIEADLQAHTEALAAVAAEYTFTGQITDFEALVEAKADALMQNKNLDPTADERMKDFERKVWRVNHRMEAREGDEDDDIIMDDEDQACNARCPITGKAVLDLKDPVQDSKGYVYEKACVIQFIKSTARKNGGIVRCPQNGTTHNITEKELKPARSVIRAIKRAQQDKQAGDPDAVEVE